MNIKMNQSFPEGDGNRGLNFFSAVKTVKIREKHQSETSTKSMRHWRADMPLTRRIVS